MGFRLRGLVLCLLFSSSEQQGSVQGLLPRADGSKMWGSELRAWGNPAQALRRRLHTVDDLNPA